MATTLAKAAACHQGEMGTEVSILAKLEKGVITNVVTFDANGKPTPPQVNKYLERATAPRTDTCSKKRRPYMKY